MTLSDLLLLLHIAAAGTWLGANLVQMAVPAVARNEGAAFTSGWLRVGARLGSRLYMPVGVLLFATGVGLVLTGPYEFDDPFVGIGVAVVVIGAVLGMAVFTPSGLKAAEALENGDEPRFRSLLGKISGFAVLDTTLIVLAMLTMILRLGA